MRRGKDLDRAPDFLVTPDDRVELSLARVSSEVASIFLERVVLGLGRRRIGGPALADFLDRLIERLGGVTPASPSIFAVLASFSMARANRSRSTVTNESPAFLASLFGGLEYLCGRAGEIELTSAAPANCRKFGERLLGRRKRIAGASAGTLDETGREALRIVQEHLENMLRCKLLMTGGKRPGLGRLNKSACPIRIGFEIHGFSPDPKRTASIKHGTPAPFRTISPAAPLGPRCPSNMVWQ